MKATLSLFAASAILALAVAPSAQAVGLVGLTDSNSLVLFESGTPGASTTVAVTGISGTLIGIDYRPANGLLYGLTTTNALYTINTTSGIASFVSSLSTPFTGGIFSGFDFNPAADRLRLVAGGDNSSVAVNVDNGAVVVNGNVTAGADISGSAYTNSFAGATSTVLFGIDSAAGTLVTQVPGTGVLTTRGSLGLGTNLGSSVGFDIFSLSGGDLAFATIGSNLYNIDLASGAASLIGGTGSNFIGVTAVIPEPSPLLGSLPLAGLFGFILWKKRSSNEVA